MFYKRSTKRGNKQIHKREKKEMIKIKRWKTTSTRQDLNPDLARLRSPTLSLLSYGKLIFTTFNKPFAYTEHVNNSMHRLTSETC